MELNKSKFAKTCKTDILRMMWLNNDIKPFFVYEKGLVVYVVLFLCCLLDVLLMLCVLFVWFGLLGLLGLLVFIGVVGVCACASICV